MMESFRTIFDLSSYDDAATPTWEEPMGDDYNWLSELLEAAEKLLGDHDDLMVVEEVNPTEKSKPTNSVVGKVDEEDDSDCVVLEGDPDKELSDVNDPQEDSDECLIVGQKGQIACRDYPHPRHDCAKFPFSSTSHEQHCELCHCYVCDLQAPCRFWGSGTSITDHCHATVKEVKWKDLRKIFRHGSSPILVTKAPVISHSTAMPQLNQAPQFDNMQYTLQNQLSRLTPRNSVAQSHIQLPSIIRACSSTRYGFPYNRSMGSQRVLNRSTMHPNPISRQLPRLHNTIIQRNRGINIRNLGPQFVPSNTMSRRMEVTSTTNHTAYAPSENISSIASQLPWNPASVAISNESDSYPIGWPNLCFGSNLGAYTHPISSQPFMDSISTNSAPSQSSAYGHPVLQSSFTLGTNHLQNQQATNHASSDYDLNWINIIGQSNQTTSVDYLQLQNSTNEIDASMEINEGHSSAFNELENFLLYDQPFPDYSLAAELNSVSSNHMSYDTGMIFFDIDTSLDRLTHA